MSEKKKYIVEANDDAQMILCIGVRDGFVFKITGNTDTYKTADKELKEAYLQGKHDAEQDLARAAYEEAFQKGYDEAKLIYQNPNAESDYQRGLDDAWDCARKLVTNWYADADDVFEDKSFVEFLNAYTASEAIAKLKAYEEQQKADDEIKVGDEVTPKSNNSNWFGVVVGVDDTNAMVMTRDGYTAMYRLEILKKTDRHFQQVAELLKAMKEGAE